MREHLVAPSPTEAAPLPRLQESLLGSSAQTQNGAFSRRRVNQSSGTPRLVTERTGQGVGDEPARFRGLADRSLVKALDVLKEMKAAGRTWQEMAERVEREFGTRLDKDQLKALVR